MEPVTCNGRMGSGEGTLVREKRWAEAGTAHMDKTSTANIPSESWDEPTWCHSIGTPDMYKEA